MVTVEAETEKVSIIRRSLKDEEEEAKLAAAEAHEMKIACEVELSDVMPQLLGSIEALNKLTSSDIAEIKSLKV